MRLLFTVLRAAVAAAITAAVVGQLAVSIDFWQGRGVQHIGVNITNFFSFFTIDSNVGSAVMLAFGAVFLLAGRGEDSRWFLLIRASFVSYMVVTGIVYNLLLRGIELPQGSTLAWSNEILHVVAPIYLLIDWLFAPGRRPLSTSAVGAIVSFPVVWVVYTLVRGPLVTDEVAGKPFWYPYPFLNPNTSAEGYFSVAFYVVLIALVISAVGIGVVWVSRRMPRTAVSGVGAR